MFREAILNSRFGFYLLVFEFLFNNQYKIKTFFFI